MAYSLYKAATIIADRLDGKGFKRAEILDIYRTMQTSFSRPVGDRNEIALPKSAGRAVYGAHPNLVAQLLIGVAGARTGLSPLAFTELFANARSIRKEGWSVEGTLRDHIALAFRNPALAATIVAIYFQCSSQGVEIDLESGEQMVFAADGGGVDRWSKFPIRHNPEIDGALILDLSNSIEWHRVSGPTVLSKEAEE